MTTSRIVTIFGSGQIDEGSSDYQNAVSLGLVLADAGFVICNGGYAGIMEASARGAKEAGGKTIGIVTSQFSTKANKWIDETRCAPTWKERLFQLVEAADAFVLFDGGTGTLTELSVVWEMTNKAMLSKPIIICGPFFRSLVKEFKKQPLVQFNNYLKIAETAEDVLEYLK